MSPWSKGREPVRFDNMRRQTRGRGSHEPEKARRYGREVCDHVIEVGNSKISRYGLFLGHGSERVERATSEMGASGSREELGMDRGRRDEAGEGFKRSLESGCDRGVDPGQK